jgi:HEAT repeat protein
MPRHLLPAIARLDRDEGRTHGERLLTHSDERIRESALYFLVHEAYRESAPAIAKLTDASQVFPALADLNAREQIPTLLEALKHPAQRDHAALALGKMGAAEALPALRPLLRSESDDTRYAAAQALGDLRDRESIPGLEALLEAKDPFVRAAACQALGRLGSMERLKNLLEDEDTSVVDAALIALGDRKGLAEAFKRGDSDRRRALLPAVLRAGDLETLRALPEPRGPFLVQEGGNALNALRTPDAWRRLRDAKLPRDLEGTGQEIVESIARQAGLKVEGAIDTPRYARISTRGGLTTLLDALEALEEGFVLEADRIRFVDGRPFWRTWWASQESKW